jgi:chlorobactene glucosyltransferase
VEPYLLSLPWVAFIVYVAGKVRLPRPLAPGPFADADADVGAGKGGHESAGQPAVTVVVPARNEAENIERCVGSLSRSVYSDFEILVIDDRSEDGTGELARALPPGNAREIRVMDGQSLPAGWLGKPWACHQAAMASQGGLLLFTDADTTHHPELLARSVASLREDGAQALTLVGRQVLGSFWEYLLQPQMFGLLALRYPDLRRTFDARSWNDAIANGQYVLIDRSAYESVGGHESVKGEVVEDMRFAQVVCRAGNRLSIRGAEEHFATRMYRSLNDIVEGWGKNVYVGSRQSMGGRMPFLAALTPAAMVFTLLALWVTPSVALLLSLAGVLSGAVVPWSVITYGLSTLFWVAVHYRFRAPIALAPLHALGALFVVGIILKSWRGGGRVRWKGREYHVSTS